MMPLVMPKVSLSTLTTGARQLVVQEALEMMLCFAASYLSSLTPRTMVMSSLEAGAEMMTFLTVVPRWSLGLFGVGEEAGGLDDDLCADGCPVELGGVALGEDLDLLAVDGDEVGAVGDLLLEVSEDGIVLEQVGEGGRGGEVVDGDEFDVGVAESGAEDVASDAAEAVDAYLYCHRDLHSCVIEYFAFIVEQRTDQRFCGRTERGGEQAGSVCGRCGDLRVASGLCYKRVMRELRDKCLMFDWISEKMRRRPRRGPNESESTGKSGQELPSNQPAPLRPTYPDALPARPVSPQAAVVVAEPIAQPSMPEPVAVPFEPAAPERRWWWRRSRSR